MPEFNPQHTPAGLDDFLTGYLQAAEFTADETDLAKKIRGWSRAALHKAGKDCAQFQRENADNLALYVELRTPELESRGYSAEECAGHDFWLTRNGHGAGFADRGNDPVFDMLDEAAAKWSECYMYRTDSGWLDLT